MILTTVLLLLQATLPLLERPVLRYTGSIPLPVNGRIDHMAADVSGHRVFVAALGNNSVEVVDVKNERITHSIGGLREPQGVYFDAEQRILYVANGGDGKVRAFNAQTFAPVRDYDFNSDADDLRFDPRARELFVGYGDGALGVINVDMRQRVGQTMLAGHPEAFELEANGPRIFINVPQEANVTVIDRRTRTVVAKWPVTRAKDNFPMAHDAARRRIFVACRRPARFIAMDASTGKELMSLPVVSDADDMWYDKQRHRIFVSGGGGFISIIRQITPNRYIPDGAVSTHDGARTSLFVPEWRTLFVAVPHRGRQRAELMMFTVQ